MGRGKARSSRALPKHIIMSDRKIKGFGPRWVSQELNPSYGPYPIAFAPWRFRSRMGIQSNVNDREPKDEVAPSPALVGPKSIGNMSVENPSIENATIENAKID